jgi:hypothetical protein
MKGQVCHGCSQPRAGGGQRFCWACLGLILTSPQPYPAAADSGYRYPRPRRRRARCTGGYMPPQATNPA